jgi:hypothetical protein
MLMKLKNYLKKKEKELYPKASVLKKLIPEYFKKYGGNKKLVTGKIRLLCKHPEGFFHPFEGFYKKGSPKNCSQSPKPQRMCLIYIKT